jgi:pyruvate dehydrogenase E2 component (dihydrolipoamide acetyltransferase)
MPIQILMPALSPTMEEGKLAKWLVKEGQQVKSGDIIAEIETDKATMEVEAVDEGKIGQILVPAGTEKVKVNTPIAVLLADGEALGATKAAAPPVAQASQGQTPQALAAQAMAPAVTAAPTMPSAMTVATGTSGRVFASPLARRIAGEAKLDLKLIKGTGPNGRIVQADVETALKSGTAKAVPLVPQGTSLAPQGASSGAVVAPMADDKILALYDKSSFDVVPHDGMRRIIAQRLTQSKQTVPHFYLNISCVLDSLLAARERINAASPKTGAKAYKLSVNDFVIKAWGLALQKVPGANATWTEGGMLRHRHSDVGVAVAVEGGLFTPIIRHVELKTLADISNEMKDLADRARKKRLAPHEYQGGTTSISNLGMFGISSFDAVINPPHATIVAVGAGERKAIVNSKGAIEVATVMNVTLSCDHRVVDGALGAEALNAFKGLIEDPVRMLV